MGNRTSDKNVANIERLNRFANMTFLYGNRVNLDMNSLKEIQKDIKHLLAEREQKDKRIKELEEKLLDTIHGTEIIRNETPEYIKENYIPKQVVIDKMEELNKEIKSCDEIDAIFKIKQQQILQELLEGEKNENIQTVYKKI